MDLPDAKIRYYTTKDKKLVQFMISKANFQGLAVANNKTYLHPITIAVWLALVSIFIQWMSWWPTSEYGWIGYLKPLPAMASIAVPIMFVVDWINRPYFEQLTQDVLRYGDLRDIEKYYSKDSSGFWILELGNTFVGLIAIDGTQPTTKPRKGESATPKTAVIRHFHVEEAFHKAEIQDDLLEYAVNQAFSKDSKLERIEVTDSSLISYRRRSLRAAGFELDRNTQAIGILRWKLGVRHLERSKWSKNTQ